jgi:hypothetical protein
MTPAPQVTAAPVNKEARRAGLMAGKASGGKASGGKHATKSTKPVSARMSALNAAKAAKGRGKGGKGKTAPKPVENVIISDEEPHEDEDASGDMDMEAIAAGSDE